MTRKRKPQDKRPAPSAPQRAPEPAAQPQIGDEAPTGAGSGAERMLGGGPDSIYDPEGEAQLDEAERREREK